MSAVIAPDLLSPFYPVSTPAKQWHDALERLSGARQRWVALSLRERVDLLRICLNALQLEAQDWVRAACRAKGYRLGSAAEGEEWLAGPVAVIRNIRLLMEALEAGRSPSLQGLQQGPGGRSIAHVFPGGRKERLLFQGFRGEVWLRPDAPSSQGSWGDGSGKLCVVLGAGNQTSIAPMDVLYKMFVEGQVCILKMSPVNAYVGPYIVRAFWKLIEANYFTVVYGGVDLGAELCAHPAVEAIHVTGSHHTHDAIVWGSDLEERASRKARNEPLNALPVTSELGCITPILVTPGKWSAAALKQQARQTATMLSHNGGFNCNAGQVLMLSRSWPQRQAFLSQVAETLTAIGSRRAYYPGARGRWQAMLSRYPDARQIGASSGDMLPWTMADDIPLQPGQAAFTEEAFCSFYAVTYLDEASPDAFLHKAVAFCNDHIWGNLSCAILHGDCPPSGAVLQAVTALRYGTIGVNVWPGVAFGLGVMPWGAYPGNTLQDVQSGIGVVHNTTLLDHVEKGVLWGDPVIRPDPVWMVDRDIGRRIGPSLVRFETGPRVWKLPLLALSALRS